VVRFEEGDDYLRGLVKVVREEGIRCATVQLLGGLRRARLVTGPKSAAMPPEPVWREVAEPSEILAFGTVFPEDGEPRIHLHGAVGRGDGTRVGCLREISETFLVAEAVLTEILDIDAVRAPDPVSGMTLLRL